MSFLQAVIPANVAVAAANAANSSVTMDPAERDERKKAVQKFLARAEISMVSFFLVPRLFDAPWRVWDASLHREDVVFTRILYTHFTIVEHVDPEYTYNYSNAPHSQVTRGLRARLSYASYKAAHNIPHVPLRDLESSHSPYAAGPGAGAGRGPAIGGKRKASASNNYYNNPATQGVHNPAPNTNYGQHQQRGRGSMAPPSLSPSLSLVSLAVSLARLSCCLSCSSLVPHHALSLAYSLDYTRTMSHLSRSLSAPLINACTRLVQAEMLLSP